MAVRLKLNPKDWLDGQRLCDVLGLQKDQRWGADTLSDMAVQNRSLIRFHAASRTSRMTDIGPFC